MDKHRNRISPRGLVRAAAAAACVAGAALAPAAHAQAPPDPGVPSLPSGPAPSSQRAYVPGELIVKYRRGVDVSQRRDLAARLDGRVDRRLAGGGTTHVIELDSGSSVAEAVREFERQDDVVYAEPNYHLESFAVPNDPDFGRLWGMRNTGQAGVAGVDIDATRAWDLTAGSRDVVVAVVDSGVDLDHPDLAGNIWTNAGETGSGRESNGIDDDGNGRIDDWRGWDFADSDNEPDDGNAAHGTHVAGTIGARGNNGIGVAGVAWNVRLMAVRALADDPRTGMAGGTTETISNAMAYAARNGARIVNLSLGGRADVVPQTQLDAIRSAPNTLWVVAAGNAGSDNDAAPVYPCNFSVTEPNVICVAATDSEDRLASFSNYGRTTVQIAAPGASIHSASPRSQVQDDFESAVPDRWLKYSEAHASGAPVSNSWARTNEAALSGSFSWTDTPAANYFSPMNSGFMHPYWFSTVLKEPNNACYLDFRLRQQVGGGVYEAPFHVLKIDMASGDFPYWNTTELFQLSSFGSGWQQLNLPLAPIYWNNPRVALRFRFEVGFGASSGAGIWIDDVRLWCGDPTGAPLPDYRSENGTSMAAPHVSGAAALLAAYRPGISAAALRQTLIASAEGATASLSGKVGSCRRLNAHRALVYPAVTGAAACPTVAEPPPPPPAKPAVTIAGAPRLTVGSRGTARLRPGMTLACPTGKGACVAAYRLRGTVPVSSSTRTRTVVLARGSISVPEGRRRAAAITISRATVRRYRQHRRIRSSVRMTLRTAAGEQASASRRLTLRLPRR